MVTINFKDFKIIWSKKLKTNEFPLAFFFIYLIEIYKNVILYVVSLFLFFHHFLSYLKLKDPETSPYKTIQEAVDAAEPGSVIKVAPGLYSDNLVIKWILVLTKENYKRKSQKPHKKNIK